MKKAWEKPSLEVLDVSMTMKGWPGHGGGDKEPDPGDEPDDVFGS